MVSESLNDCGIELLSARERNLTDRERKSIKPTFALLVRRGEVRCPWEPENGLFAGAQCGLRFSLGSMQ